VRADEGQCRAAERQEQKGDHDGQGNHACRCAGAAERCGCAGETPDAGSGGGSARADLRRYGLAELIEFSGGDVEDEAADGVFVGDEGAGLDPGGGLADVLVEVGKASADQAGLMPVSSWMARLNASSVKVSMPQSVWWMRMISVVRESLSR
jgi:hypothetical protein